MIARRAEIAIRLRQQVEPLARRVRGLGDAERRAVFYKLEHEGPIDARVIGFRPVGESTERFTIAIPRENTFDRITQRLDQFETGAVRSGMVPHAQSISRILNISEGAPTDRLSQQLFEQYAQLIQQPSLIIEVELLSVAQGPQQKRRELQSLLEALRTAIQPDGVMYEHEEMKGSCRVVVRCSGGVFRQLVEGAEWQRTITWFEPRPEFETFTHIASNFNIASLGEFTAPATDAPIVCVVDTGVTIGNPFLRPVTRENLVRSFLPSQPDNASDEFGHGSGVASLVAYYALNIAAAGRNTAKVWIASARVLNAHNEEDQGRLFSVAISEVVRTFAPLGVKIFNLSVNIRNRNWNENARRTMPRRSWIARRIDQLSREYDAVFVVSTGNVNPIDVRRFQTDGGAPYPRYLLHPDASLLDPAQSALAITVGSVAGETLVAPPQRGAAAMAERDQPSPFTRSGSGISGEIKPEVVDYGGNYVIDEAGPVVREHQALSIAVASHQLTPAIRYSVGTSLAAPRVSHKLGLIQQDLSTLGIQPSASLLRAFLVNSARLPLDPTETEALAVALGNEPRNWMRVLGYGLPDADRATGCDPYSATMYYQGMIDREQILFIDIPVPIELQGAAGTRKRLTVTVAHSPEVQQWGLEQYLGTVLKWRMFRGDIQRDAVISAMSRADDEDRESPPLPEELTFNLGVRLRSRGTVQNDVAEWMVHRPEYSANHYTLAITSFSRWERQTDPVPFAVVVRLEETGRTTPIYATVQAALVALQVRARI